MLAPMFLQSSYLKHKIWPNCCTPFYTFILNYVCNLLIIVSRYNLKPYSFLNVQFCVPLMFHCSQYYMVGLSDWPDYNIIVWFHLALCLLQFVIKVSNSLIVGAIPLIVPLLLGSSLVWKIIGGLFIGCMSLNS